VQAEAVVRVNMEDGEAFFGELVGFFVAVAFSGVGFGA
jgi:hypothetical protein